jgi:DHA1 family multidrug resistance protein-like MFS transporter
MIKTIISKSKKRLLNIKHNTNWQIFAVLSIYLFQGIINNLGHPVTPRLVTSTGIPNEMFGIFFATMSFGLVVGGPIWGVLGDTWNKETLILIGMIIYSIGQYLFGFVDDMYWKVVFRFMSGFGVSAAITLLLSHLITISPNENRTKYIARSVALMGLGGSLGYLLGGALNTNQLLIRIFQTDQYENVFLIQAILNTILACAVFIILRKQQVKVISQEKLKQSQHILSGFKHLKDVSPNLLLFLISVTLISVGAINISKFLEVYFNELGYDPGDIGNFVFVTGIVSILTSMFVVPQVAKLRRDFKFLIYIQLVSAMIIFVVFHIQGRLIIILYTVFMIYVILKAIYSPLEQSYISKHAKDGRYGTMMGIRQSFFSIGMVIGPLVGGLLYAIKPIYVFDLSAIMFLLGFLLLLFLEKKVKRELRAIKVNS